MNYELAIELNDAGFPNMRVGQYWAHGLGAHSDTRDDTPCHCNEDKFPTLEELIEACGDRTIHVMKTRIDECAAWCTEAGVPTFRGSTPAEAVAHLWLALNKKV